MANAPQNRFYGLSGAFRGPAPQRKRHPIPPGTGCLPAYGGRRTAPDGTGRALSSRTAFQGRSHRPARQNAPQGILRPLRGIPEARAREWAPPGGRTARKKGRRHKPPAPPQIRSRLLPTSSGSEIYRAFGSRGVAAAKRANCQVKRTRPRCSGRSWSSFNFSPVGGALPKGAPVRASRSSRAKRGVARSTHRTEARCSAEGRGLKERTRCSGRSTYTRIP